MVRKATRHWLKFNHDYIKILLVPIIRELLRKLKIKEVDYPIDNLQQLEAGMPSIDSEDVPYNKICKYFKLSPFEQNLLLLCIGFELDPKFASICMQACKGDQSYITLNLALDLFNESYQEVLSLDAPLRSWQLIDVVESTSLLLSPLKINQRIFNYLMGNASVDKDLANVLYYHNIPIFEISSHIAIAEQLRRSCLQTSTAYTQPIINLYGADLASKQNIIALIINQLQRWLYQINIQVLLESFKEIANLQRLLLRFS